MFQNDIPETFISWKPEVIRKGITGVRERTGHMQPEHISFLSLNTEQSVCEAILLTEASEKTWFWVFGKRKEEEFTAISNELAEGGRNIAKAFHG